MIMSPTMMVEPAMIMKAVLTFAEAGIKKGAVAANVSAKTVAIMKGLKAAKIGEVTVTQSWHSA